MATLRQLPLRSVLLTSGTLSPLESFAHELQLGFKYTLENPHVINPNQVSTVRHTSVSLSPTPVL
jgi:regulator of telomere elongation helicase 1